MPPFASGGYAEGTKLAQQIVELEPYRESGYRRLMQAHAGAGNRAEGLRVYERCRRFLANELGAYPSPETESIYKTYLQRPLRRSRHRAPPNSVGVGAAFCDGRRSLFAL
jgi:DNA-binding SARP family transcriptional activator